MERLPLSQQLSAAVCRAMNRHGLQHGAGVMHPDSQHSRGSSTRLSTRAGVVAPTAAPQRSAAQHGFQRAAALGMGRWLKARSCFGHGPQPAARGQASRLAGLYAVPASVLEQGRCAAANLHLLQNAHRIRNTPRRVPCTHRGSGLVPLTPGGNRKPSLRDKHRTQQRGWLLFAA